MTDEFNPYAAPRAIVQGKAVTPAAASPGGLWRSGEVLIMHKMASLPNRCVVCNAPSRVRLPRKLYWHNPWLYILVLVSCLIYAIVALVVRKKAELEIPVCDEHEARRRKGVTLAWALSLGGLVASFAGFIDIDRLGALSLVGFLVLLAGLIVGSVKSRVVVPKKIDDTYVWLLKVCPEFLASVPPAPPGV